MTRTLEENRAEFGDVEGVARTLFDLSRKSAAVAVLANNACYGDILSNGENNIDDLADPSARALADLSAAVARDVTECAGALWDALGDMSGLVNIAQESARESAGQTCAAIGGAGEYEGMTRGEILASIAETWTAAAGAASAGEQ